METNKEAEEDEEEKGSESEEEELIEMCPVKMIMEQLGNQYIILEIYGQKFITQDTLDKSINFQIRTRIFENFGEIVKCADCNSICYEGLLPVKRIQEGLRMKQW